MHNEIPAEIRHRRQMHTDSSNFNAILISRSTFHNIISTLTRRQQDTDTSAAHICETHK